MTTYDSRSGRLTSGACLSTGVSPIRITNSCGLSYGDTKLTGSLLVDLERKL